MIKRYCDVCEEELVDGRNYVSQRLTLRHKDVKNDAWVNVEVVCGVGHNGLWNHGDICKPCLLKAISNGEEVKPRA